jgi:hypothetical protein
MLGLVAMGLSIVWAAEYSKRWCPAGTDPEADPHCFVQYYLGVRPRPRFKPPPPKEPIFYQTGITR